MFQIVLLTDRELKTEALLGRTDCTVIERADAPTAKQVAVIWVQDDGEAPLINGIFLLIVVFWVYDMFSRHTISAHPNLYFNFFLLLGFLLSTIFLISPSLLDIQNYFATPIWHAKIYNFKFFIGIAVHQNLFTVISFLRLLGSR